jgi:cystathionine beta-lyase
VQSTLSSWGRGSNDDGFTHLDLAWLRAKPGVKWAEAARAGDDVLPCWVADMDFPAPAAVRDALSRLAEGADLGYSPGREPALLEERWALRMASRYGWSPTPGRLRVFTDLVQATQAVIGVTTKPGDGVILFTPSYPPFLRTIEEMGRQLVAVPALYHGPDAGWSFDMAAAEAGAASARVVLLVNPHNPTGRMLTRSELIAVGELAERHDLVVISDEVHADLAVAGLTHIPFASLSPALEARTVTLYSASKSYNLGGMCCAVAHVGPSEVERGLAALPFHLLGRVGVAAVAATMASWTTEGDAWLERCLGRLRANRDRLAAWLTGPGAAAGARGSPPEGTYLAWLDFRPCDLGDDPAQWLLAHARVLLSAGPSFGPEGAGFARLNFATTPGLLDEILTRVATALAGDRHAPGHQRRP